MGSYVEFKNVKKSYDMGEVVINAVDDVSFSIEKGELVVILGASGAGKSTILNLLGGMDHVSSGSIYVDGNEISKYDKRLLTKYRRDDIGFVFQFYNLVQNLNALENVELAVEICEDSIEPEEVLKSVGLEDRLYNFPSQLSGGEQQRVSIARAIAKNPKLLLCDEPTGALDYNTGKAILKLLSDTARAYNMTVVVITHNSAIAPIADRIITVKSGKISSVKINENPVSIESIEW
jgi:putative ABC transport system ATP-binding protein